MVIGVLKELTKDKRVSLIPAHLKKLANRNCELLVETDAGKNAFFNNSLYENIGARITTRNEILNAADILTSVNQLSNDEYESLGNNQITVGILNPLSNKKLVELLIKRKLTSFSLDMIPRISRAQDKDILSSMATVTGYKAVLDAALHLPKFFPLLMTAAGTLRPSNILVLGAGVAGLQAIATAKRLGAQVFAFDVRKEVKEQTESLGAKFVEVEGASENENAGGYAVEQTEEYKQKQAELIHQKAIEADVVITTAQIPGRKAPVLIKEETVKLMKGGSVIVDLAASTGGNCELTKENQIIQKYSVTIIGKSDYASDTAVHASEMFSKNTLNFLNLLINDKGELNLNFEDEIIKESCVTHQGEISAQRVKSIF